MLLAMPYLIIGLHAHLQRAPACMGSQQGLLDMWSQADSTDMYPWRLHLDVNVSARRALRALQTHGRSF